MSDVKIRIVATDESGGVFEGAVSNLGDLEEQGEKAGRSFDRFARASQGVSNIVERGMRVSTQLHLANLNVTESTERVSDAQTKYNDAVSKYGQASTQAIQASRELDNAQAAMERTNRRAMLSYALVGLEVGTLAVTKLPALIRGLNTYAASATGAAAASAKFAAALAPIAAGVGAGALLAGQLANALDEFSPARLEQLKQTAEGIAKIRTELERIEAHQQAHPTMAKIGEGMAEIVNWLPGVDLGAEKVEHLRQALEDAGIAAQVGMGPPLPPDYMEKFGQFESGIRGLGISLQQLDPSSLTRISALGGQFGFLAGKALEAQMAEGEWIKTALAADASLQSQIVTMARKNETAEEFKQRMLGAGMGEDEFNRRVDESGLRLRSQKEMMAQATTAVQEHTEALAEQARTESLYAGPNVTASRFTPGGPAPSPGPGGTTALPAGTGVGLDDAGTAVTALTNAGNQLTGSSTTLTEAGTGLKGAAAAVTTSASRQNNSAAALDRAAESLSVAASALLSAASKLSTPIPGAAPDPLRQVDAYRRD